ncbi:LAFE_0F07382g1_1 [Lachancea fermentati]|uniref:LAFE_0F07382g1_1 n=1 Tax=Lachancea fermentati TaxID=4955 RepID=A0A1G4MEZ8_LACFM|nr:LAFE_0F07382g1_1 [Lachancea fermentati]
MTEKEHAFIGGLITGTKIFLSDGRLIPVEEIKVGARLMSLDGSDARVSSIHSSVDDILQINQTSCHTAHLRDENRAPPWGLIELGCSKRQRMKLRTKQRVKRITRKPERCSIIEITQLREHVTEDGRTIQTLRTTSKQFPPSCSSQTIEEYIESCKVPNGFITWESELDDLKYLNKELRASTRLILCPLAVEIPMLLPWLESKFNRGITDKELEAMAWLLGFWIGNGHRRGAKFSLRSGDHDVNDYLEACGTLWGMTLRIVLRDPENGYKADGYLHTFDGEVRNWNRNNPLVKVLEGLRFYQNGRLDGKKAIPSFMKTEQRLVREAFMAGLIDSDGFINIQDHCLRVKISTISPLIRDGILSVGRSMGLNVTVHFCPEKQNLNGYHESDTWVFHLFGGSNHGTLWSILCRCSCERKRNPPIQFVRKRDVAEFETDDEEDSDVSLEEALGEWVEAPSNNDKGLLARSSAGGRKVSEIISEDDQFEQGGDESSEFDLEDDDNNLHFAFIPFKTSQVGTAQVFGITFSEDSNIKPFLTEQQVMCFSAHQLTNETRSNASFSRSCLSCHGTVTIEWYKLPWDTASARRLCSVCYKQYSRSKMRCCNCNKVFSKSIMQARMRKESMKTCMSRDGKRVQGYSCDTCDGVIEQPGSKNTNPHPSDKHRSGSCYFCDSQESGGWRKVPWVPDKEWCSVCRSRYGGTATVCTNDKCRKIPFKGEFNKMEAIDESLGHYKCLKCGSVARKDLKKQCRAVKKLEEREGTCYSCGPTTSKRWNGLPWDKKAPAEICQRCYHLWRGSGERCFNPSCRRIFTKTEVFKMKKLKHIDGPSGASTKCRPCIVCRGPTTLK